VGSGGRLFISLSCLWASIYFGCIYAKIETRCAIILGKTCLSIITLGLNPGGFLEVGSG
jgi:hypothetical protein